MIEINNGKNGFLNVIYCEISRVFSAIIMKKPIWLPIQLIAFSTLK